MSEALDIDVAALVGEMADIPCESDQHTSVAEFHDQGPATHYGRVHCPMCGLNLVKAYCSRFVEAVACFPSSECICGATSRTPDLITIIGPIKP